MSVPSQNAPSHKKPPIVPVTEGWKEKESLKLMIAEAQANRQRFLQVLLKLDKELTHKCSVTVFLQSSVDADINFDEKSIEYIQRKSDSKGEINYMRLVRDMVIRSTIAFTGSIIL